MSQRAEHEITHGVFLARHNAEEIWGWSTPAGKLRAARRGSLIANGAGLRPGKRILEIGCGTGLFTERFAASGATMVAVDISADLLDQARRRGLPSPQVTFLEKRFEDCDVEGPFDGVIGSSILHHLDLAAAMARIFTLLNAGGVISFAEPNMLNPQILAQKNVPLLKRLLGDSPDETAIIRWRFARLLANLGFQQISITPFDWLHPATPRSLIPAVRDMGRCLEGMPIAREFAGSVYIRARKPAPAGSPVVTSERVSP
ncbi:MAG: class I SAM-dependent methyltransferase [Chloroflexales bacterium]